MGCAYDYIYPPLPESTKQAAVNDSLLMFMTQSQGFNKELFEVKNG
jgi:hypothetical protein